MWEKVPKVTKRYYSDGYDVYVENLPSNKLEVGKKGINRNESLHAVLRDRISRLKRRTKSYSKSEKALSCHIAIALIYGGRTHVCYSIF